MAHLAKYKEQALGHLIAHYERSRETVLDRSNIDKGRTRLNYNLRPTDMLAAVRAARDEHRRTVGRKARSDAVVMADWIVTLPGNVPEEMGREFFESAVRFIEGRYGAGNVVGAHVHMDETTPHVHVSVVPLKDGRLQATEMMGRADLNGFHEALSAAVSADLGFGVEILLDDEKMALKELSRLPQAEYKAARAEIEATTERLESVRRSWEETRGNPVSDFREAREERALDREIERLEREVERVEGEVAAEERRVAGLDARIREVAERIRELVARLREMLAPRETPPRRPEQPHRARPGEFLQSAQAQNASRGRAPGRRGLEKSYN